MDCVGAVGLRSVNELNDSDILKPGRFQIVNSCVKELLVADAKEGTVSASVHAKKAVELLVNSIRCCYESLPPISITTVGDIPDTIDETITLYEKALSLSTDIRLPDLLESCRQQRLKRNAHLWLNFLLLSSIEFSDPDSNSSQPNFRVLFEKALESVKGKEGRYLLWREYLSFEGKVAGFGEKSTLAVLWRAINDLCGGFEKSPLESSRALEIPDFAKLVGVKEFGLSTNLLKFLLSGFSREKALEVVELLMKSRSELLHACPSFSRLYFELDMVESGKSFLIDCLKCNPKSPHIWKLIYQIEDLGGQFGSAESVKRICRLAEETLPETEAAFFRHVC
ncbi:hypothetical protein BDR26DRAFT_883266 [Obelidium mucronatum]|nr:hypothetical protein BDR26DRAFT_883266 [Obelidium mucronatum]